MKNSCPAALMRLFHATHAMFVSSTIRRRYPLSRRNWCPTLAAPPVSTARPSPCATYAPTIPWRGLCCLAGSGESLSPLYLIWSSPCPSRVLDPSFQQGASRHLCPTLLKRPPSIAGSASPLTACGVASPNISRSA